MKLVALLAVTAVAGCNCPGGDVDCGAQPEQFSVGATDCGDTPCEIDFGAVAGGLSASERVTFVTSCNDFVFDAAINGDAVTFAIGDTGFELGDNFNEGFVFVEAQPTDNEEHSGTLALISDSGTEREFPLIVNAD